MTGDFQQGKIPLGVDKGEILEEKGEREETPNLTPTSVLLPGETKRGERSSLSDRKRPYPLTPSGRRDFHEGEPLLSKWKEKERNWGKPHEARSLQAPGQ